MPRMGGQLTSFGFVASHGLFVLTELLASIATPTKFFVSGMRQIFYVAPIEVERE
jgi:hypothetical protein